MKTLIAALVATTAFAGAASAQGWHHNHGGWGHGAFFGAPAYAYGYPQTYAVPAYAAPVIVQPSYAYQMPGLLGLGLGFGGFGGFGGHHGGHHGH